MKLLASDFDGTFYFKNRKLFLKNLTAARTFQKKNVIAIVTGRDAASVMHKFENTGFQPDYLAVYNGGRVLDSKGQLLYKDPLKIDLDRLYETLVQENVSQMSILSLTKVFHKSFHFDIHDWLYMMNNRSLKRNVVEDYHEIEDDIYMCSISCESEEKALLLSEKLKGMKLGCSIYVNKSYIDIVGEHASKEHAVEVIAMHTQADEVFVIGDSYNDVGMLRQFESYTVESANEAIKKEADHIVESVEAAIEDIQVR